MSIAIQQVDVVEVIKARISSYDKHEQSQNYLRQHIDMIQSAASRCYQKISTADLRDHVSSRKVARMYIDQGNHFAAEHILSGSLILNASSNPQGNKEVTVDPFRDRIVGELGKLCRFYRERAIKYEREETLLVTPKIDLHLAVSRATLDLAARVDIHGLCIRLYHSGAICHEAFDEALFFAAKYDAPSLARFAFALGVGTDAVDAHGKTALHKAIEHQSVEVAKLLTARRADIEARDEAMETPLHKAVACGSKDLVTLLLSNGADIQASNNMKETPLHKATASAAISLVELLVSKGAIVDARNSFEWTSLHKAAMTGSVYLVKFLLSKYANIDAQDQYRRTALTYAIQREHSRVVECLLEHGAFVNLADREGLTALHHATIHKDYDVVRLLLRYGADIEARDNDSMTTLMRAAGEGTFQITQCLLEKGASIDTQDRWRSTALHRAAARKDLSIWGLLLDYHADPTVQDEDCNTALDLACDIFRDSPHTFHDFQTKILKARLCAEGTAQSHPTRTHPSTEDPQNYHRMSTNTSSDFMEPFRPLCVPLWPA
ncbi:MAG: hypothetical protein L6R39_007254, partial [Caloplaca ligustica]